MKDDKKENSTVVSEDEAVQKIDGEPTADEKAVEETEEITLPLEDAEEEMPEISEDDKEEFEVELLEESGEELEPELSEESGEELEPELTEEESETLELDPEEVTEKKAKRNKILKRVGISAAALVAVVYAGFVIYFSQHFLFKTYVNGYDFSMWSAKDVQADMEELVNTYELKLEESDGSHTLIDGDDIELKYVESDGIKNLIKGQNIFLWPISLWQKTELETAVGVSYAEAKLDELLNDLSIMQEENQVPPVAAQPEYDGDKFVIKKEELGSQLIAENFKAKVKEYIESFQSTLNLVEEKCYVEPTFYSDAPEVAAACDTMNEYLGASITYTFGDTTEVVDGAVISQWLTTDENMQVAYNEEGVAQYIAGLAEKYNTYKKERTFTSGNGNTVSVTGGDFGWQIDQAAEIAALEANIANKEVITKEPVYSKTAYTHGATDWGNTYVEVDLTNQYVYLFVDGSLIQSGPCVTGKPSTGCATPQGVYTVKWKKSPAILRGPKQPDGTYEWESPVTFWMPFNGGIGLHDASWQYAFGDPRGYLYAGSRGCVNLQYNMAQTIYSYVSSGTPVICHY